MGESMARSNVVGQLIRSTGVYKRSLLLYLLLIVVGVTGYYLYTQSGLSASSPLDNSLLGQGESDQWNITLGSNGDLYSEKLKLNPEIFHEGGVYRYRYQVVNNPTQFFDSLTIMVSLPQAGSEELIGHKFINNGGASSTESQLIDNQTIKFSATGIDKTAQLAIEFEVPESFIQRSALMSVREFFTKLPISVWASVSIVLPIITILILIIMAAGRFRHVAASRNKIEDLPSRLPPALLGILLNGRVTTRELAATLIDLARRGHLVIRRVGLDDYRFRRLPSVDKLAEFESVLLDQVFGPTQEKISGEEVSFYLAQELFSKKVSQSFFLVYKEMSRLGYFYTNPLALHWRYQLSGLILFITGLIGFFVNLFLISNMEYLLLFWAGMIGSSFLVMIFSKGIPVRTTLGDRELSAWLGFRRYLVDGAPITYMVYSQDKYLTYLPYAIIFDCETEWTRRFFEFPFTQPNWYIAANVATIENFANQLFPMLGYLSHALSISATPSAR